MKIRIDAGSDIAMIGAWDASRNDSFLTNAWGKKLDKVLEEDTSAGDIFVIHLGGDGGGPIDIYVDSPIPNEALAENRGPNREFLLRLPSGRLTVGGVEDYRSSNPRMTGPKSVAALQPGDYALRCYVRTSESYFVRPTRKELKAALGADDYAYFSRINNLRLLGYAILLLFPVLAFRLGWKLALLITVPVFLLYFTVQEKFVVERNSRYQRISERANEIFRSAMEKEPPLFTFHLRRLPEPGALKGGSIRWEGAETVMPTT